MASQLQECNQKADGPGEPLANPCSPSEAKGTSPSVFTDNQGFTSKEEEVECLAEDRQTCWVVLEVGLSPSLPHCPPIQLLELLLVEPVQGAPTYGLLLELLLAEPV